MINVVTWQAQDQTRIQNDLNEIHKDLNGNIPPIGVTTLVNLLNKISGLIASGNSTEAGAERTLTHIESGIAYQFPHGELPTPTWQSQDNTKINNDIDTINFDLANGIGNASDGAAWISALTDLQTLINKGDMDEGTANSQLSTLESAVSADFPPIPS